MSRRYISCRLTSVRHEESTIWYLIITDMTEWKHAQDALENQLGFLQHMIDTFPNPLFYVDTQGRFLGCNSAFSRLTGKKSRNLRERPAGRSADPGLRSSSGREMKPFLNRRISSSMPGSSGILTATPP